MVTTCNRLITLRAGKGRWGEAIRVFWLDWLVVVAAIYVVVSLVGICVSMRAASRALAEHKATVAPVVELDVYAPTGVALPGTGR